MENRSIAKQHSGLLDVLHRLMDWVWISLTAWLAHRFYFGATPPPNVAPPEFYIVATAFGLILAAWLFPHFGIYQPWRSGSILGEIRRVSVAWLTVLFILFGFAFATRSGAEFSRAWIALWTGSAWVCLVVERFALRAALRWARKAGYNQRQIVIVGSAALGADIAARIAHTPWAGLQVEGFFTDDQTSSSIPEDRILGNITDLSARLNQGGIDQVWIAMALKDEHHVREILHDLRHSTVDIKFVPDIFGFRLINHSVSDFAGLPVLNLSSSPMIGSNRMVKAIEDKVISFLILLMISPLMLLIAFGVKLSSPGPILYRQERVGWNGKPFMMLKFRSMPVDAESCSGPVWAKSGENRATRFGSFLRRTSLDELPQFLNVLTGDMSIVGPRPERPVFVDKFKDEIPDYMKKHLVKAGITGWAQVNGWRGNTDLAKRIEYDLYYIEHWSLWFDLAIILITPFKGLIAKNAY
jgi:putative colanic acid biosynthesis UDP-glucose lipid carrier transferase